MYSFNPLKPNGNYNRYRPFRSTICAEVTCQELFSPLTPSNTLCSDACRSISSTRGYLLRNYNISLEEWLTLIEQQQNRCKICSTEGTKPEGGTSLVVDHCHTTGRVRGLLCNNCNTALGLFQDDGSVLESALGYLKRSS